MSDLRETSEHCLDEDTRILRDCEIEHVRGGVIPVVIPVVQKIREIACPSIQDGTSNTIHTLT